MQRDAGRIRNGTHDARRHAAPASVHLQHGEECRLRHLYLPHLTHTFLTGLLFFEQFALTRYVAAVALRRHILTHGLHRLAGDDLGADGGLYGYVELLARNQLLELLAHLAAEVVGVVGIYERRKRIDGLAVEQYVELRQTARLVARTVVIERRISLRYALQLVVEVEDDLRQGHVEVYLHTVLRNEILVLHHTALVDAELYHGAHEVGLGDYLRQDIGLLDLCHLRYLGQTRRVMHLEHLARRGGYAVRDVDETLGTVVMTSMSNSR